MMVTLISFTLAAFLVPMKRGLISGSTYRIMKAESQRLNQKWRNISLLQYNCTAAIIIATNQNFVPTDSIFDLIEEKQLFPTSSSYPKNKAIITILEMARHGSRSA